MSVGRFTEVLLKSTIATQDTPKNDGAEYFSPRSGVGAQQCLTMLHIYCHCKEDKCA